MFYRQCVLDTRTMNMITEEIFCVFISLSLRTIRENLLEPTRFLIRNGIEYVVSMNKFTPPLSRNRFIFSFSFACFSYRIFMHKSLSSHAYLFVYLSLQVTLSTENFP